jgi:hypothetical protein
VKVILYTDDGHSWCSSTHTYGVDADFPLISSDNDRSDVWGDESVPQEICQNPNVHCAVVQYHDPHFRVLDILEEIQTGMKKVSEVADEIGPYIQILVAVAN